MRTQTLLLSLALASTPALAQNAADQPGTASPQEIQGNSMQGSDSMKTMHDGAKTADAKHKMDGMSAGHQDMMNSTQTGLDEMRLQLEQMKDQTRDIPDQSRREEMQRNNDLWQALFEHMDKHMAQMKDMMGSRYDDLPSTASANVNGKNYSQ